MTGRHRKPATIASLTSDLIEVTRTAVRTVVATVAGIPQPKTIGIRVKFGESADTPDGEA